MFPNKLHPMSRHVTPWTQYETGSPDSRVQARLIWSWASFGLPNIGTVMGWGCPLGLPARSRSDKMMAGPAAQSSAAPPQAHVYIQTAFHSVHLASAYACHHVGDTRHRRGSCSELAVLPVHHHNALDQ